MKDIKDLKNQANMSEDGSQMDEDEDKDEEYYKSGY